MAVNDREWMKEDRRPRRDTPVVVRWLIGLNVAIFLLGFFSPNWHEFFYTFGAYSYESAFADGFVWQLITYQFLHADVGHILFNMIALWVFGGAVELRFGPGKFLVFYLVCGIASALFSTLMGALGAYEPGLPWEIIRMVGASGSIYGVIAASAVLFPKARVMLAIPPVEMSVRTFALVVLAIACCYIFFNWDNAGGEAGHLGGMLMGFAIMLVRHLKQRSVSNFS